MEANVGEAVKQASQAPKKVFNFVGETLSLGDRLSELLYGVLMVASISGLVVYVGPTEEAGYYYMLLVLFITIIMWGILDGVSYALLSAANRAEQETLVESLEKETDPQRRREAIAEDLEETLVARLDEESKAKVLDIVEKGLPKDGARMSINSLTSFEKRIIVAAFLLDFTALIILVIPYLFMDRWALAGLISHSLALIMFVIIGYYYAKFAHLNKWKGAFVCGLLGLILIVFAESTNMVLI